MTRKPDPQDPGPPAAGPAVPRRLALGTLAAAALGLQGEPGAFAATPAPALPALRRGVNLSHWFEYERAQCLSAAELRGLRAWGLDHVRLPLDPLACGWQTTLPQHLPFLVELQAAVLDIVQAGLVVVIDLHLDPEFKARIEAQPALEATLLTLWDRLAATFGGWGAGQVVFELYNEPQYYGAQASRWAHLQRRLLTAVRLRAPGHLVLLSGAGGASLDGLLALTPLPDPAVAYVFHHYEPFVFTHQGVPWLDERYTWAGRRTDVRWPPSAQTTAPRVSQAATGEQQEWAGYLRAGWSAARLREVLEPAGTWARSRGVRVVCNEFGVFRATVDAASRYRWLRDVRLALEAHGLGWAVWDYTDHFGLTAESGQAGRCGQRSLDPQAAAALGLGPGPTAG